MGEVGKRGCRCKAVSCKAAGTVTEAVGEKLSYAPKRLRGPAHEGPAAAPCSLATHAHVLQPCARLMAPRPPPPAAAAPSTAPPVPAAARPSAS